MAIRTELNLRLPNSPGALANVCALMSAERIQIFAMTLEAGGQLRLVVDNHVHAAAVLREQHHQVTERDVILTAVPNSPGSLAPILGLVADAGVNIEYAYGAAGEGSPAGSVVLGVEDAERASSVSGL
jgi:hypothetical protein